MGTRFVEVLYVHIDARGRYRDGAARSAHCVDTDAQARLRAREGFLGGNPSPAFGESEGFVITDVRVF